MAFPSTSGTNSVTLAAALQQAMRIAADIKQRSQALVAAAASNVSADQIVWWPQYLSTQNALLSQYAAASGITAYAQAQVGNASLDVAGAFSAMQTAITNTYNWIVANFPKDGSGNLLYVQFGASGVLAYTVFTPAQLAGLVSALNALIATIN